MGHGLAGLIFMVQLPSVVYHIRRKHNIPGERKVAMLYFDMVMAVPLLLFANLAAHGGIISGAIFGLMVPVYVLLGLAGFWPLDLLVLFLCY